MKRFWTPVVFVCLSLLTFGPTLAQTLRGWTAIGENTTNEVSATWLLRDGLVSLTCEPGRGGLSISLVWQGAPTAGYAATDVTLQIGQTAYALPFIVDTASPSGGSGAIALKTDEWLGAKPWEGQETFLADLLAGQAMHVMFGGGQTGLPVTAMFQTMPQTDAPALRALQQACVSTSPAEPARRAASAWTIESSPFFDGRRAATTIAQGGAVMVHASCGPPNTPTLMIRHPEHPLTPGHDAFVQIVVDGRPYPVALSGTPSLAGRHAMHFDLLSALMNGQAATVEAEGTIFATLSLAGTEAIFHEVMSSCMF